MLCFWHSFLLLFYVCAIVIALEYTHILSFPSELLGSLNCGCSIVCFSNITMRLWPNG
ncbi:uncharacterized protein P174DRAFT_228050 [Aspergillus novofumigatus IBT 16806]|uniref:Uncharacterized protein n=1 Tax=Aspergillus novofumigatus (strain IBT 16806) TaxID=1392255 RepID=A0A2I1C6M5_ASPN1|nr:uncharacterized protein P174DRAFT_228050 [Aspergillus novofumigatus IBT 16806]PKX93288.1 hypothetical protein P174DRAFT_228050 [Aspergillus novofumigatus IBT 16806]